MAAIAEEGVRGATLLTRKVFLAVLLTVGVLGGGVVALAPSAQPKTETRARPAPPRPAEKPRARADLQGDPLPDGAVARLGTLRWRSAEVVEMIAYAPDGKTLASASRRGVRLFDAKGKLTREFRTAEMSVRSLAFSPDGTRLACRCTLFDENWAERRVVRIWDLAAAGKPKEYSAASIQWMGWSGAGEPLAVRQAKDAVVLAELTSGKEQRFDAKDLDEPRYGLSLCAYAPQAKILAFPDGFAAIHVWNVSTGKKLCTLETKERLVISLALSPDGRSLTSLTFDALNNTTDR